MHFLLIACDVFQETIDKILVQTPYKITTKYIKMEAHLHPKILHEDIQTIIDHAEGQVYDIILLAYGLCGNATDGITARTIPIVIPKAHDCCTLFLGSINKFLQDFGDNLSAQWTNSSYLAKSSEGVYTPLGENTMNYFGLSNNFEELVEEYGEDNAKYLWDLIHAKDKYNTKIFYISTGAADDEKNIEKMKQRAEEENKEFYLLDGDTRLIKGLFNEKWGHEYLYLGPGESIEATNDLERVIKVKKLPKS